MLQLTIPSQELYDEKTQQFVYTKEYSLRLEHSLVSISKWESKWCKPFLSSDTKTDEQTIDYVKCMTITQNVPAEAYKYLTRENLEEISKYIESPMSATWFSNTEAEGAAKKSREVITSELVYYWMISMQIPVEFQTWHLNRLLTLIKICSIKNQPEKKMTKNQIMNRNAQLNAQRRKAMNSRG